MAGVAAAPKPAPSHDLGPLQPNRCSVAAPCPHRASLPQRALRRQDPRQEPGALIPHAGICPGGRPQGRSLPGLAVKRLLDTVGVERRGRVVCGSFVRSTGSCSGRSRMSELKAPGKPFDISKREVWEAWEKVQG